MTPQSAIVALDRQLLTHGQSIMLRKTNSATGQLAARALVRNYLPRELTGIIQQGDSKVILSPSGLETFGVPPQNGFVVVDSIPRRIIVATPFKMDDELVRIELQVRG